MKMLARLARVIKVVTDLTALMIAIGAVWAAVEIGKPEFLGWIILAILVYAFGYAVMYVLTDD